MKSGSDRDPSPNDYNPESADRQIHTSAPSFSHGFKRWGSTLWHNAGIITLNLTYSKKKLITQLRGHTIKFSILKFNNLTIINFIEALRNASLI